jgi:hypothetical protein
VEAANRIGLRAANRIATGAANRIAAGRSTERGQHVVRTGVERVVAGATRAMTERLRDVRFPDAGSADQQNVLVALDEAAGGKVDDLGLRDLRVEVEVEVLE